MSNCELKERMKRHMEIVRKDVFQRKLEHIQWEFKWQKHLQEWEKVCQKIDSLVEKYGQRKLRRSL
jgi:tRNA 2-selenouridine synthase SelU